MDLSKAVKERRDFNTVVMALNVLNVVKLKINSRVLHAKSMILCEAHYIAIRKCEAL